MESLDEAQRQLLENKTWIDDSDIELLESVDNSGILEDDEVVSLSQLSFTFMPAFYIFLLFSLCPQFFIF